jgi:N-acetylglucosaminyldiphosphoundecaprenol N-acetyl-beta-D-mannosaminyltransferase
MVKLLKFNILNRSFAEHINEIINLVKHGKFSYTIVANVHMFIEAQRDRSFLNIVNNANIVTPDGKPLCIALKWLYGIEQERVAGMDLLPALLKEAELNKLKVAFYGGSEETLQQTEFTCKKLHPNLLQPLFISPPFRQLTDEEENDHISQINEFGTHILFVALGCPKQEKWMAAMKGRINATMIGIGGALPVFAGTQKRAPKWMQRTSLEWLFRLVQEPRRLFKRYLITNSLFIWIILKEKLKLTLNRKYRRSVFKEMNLT